MNARKNILKNTFLTANLLMLVFCLQTFELNAQSTFSGQRIKALAENYIKTKFGENCTPVLLIEPNDFKFNESSVKAKFEFQERNVSSIQKLFLAFYSQNQLIKTYELPFRVKIKKEVIVAKRDILPNEIITKDDILLENIEVDNINDIMTDISQINKMSLKRRVKAGDVIRKSFLKPQNIIKNGQLVTLKVISGTVTIETTGTALQDAACGDVIRVRRVDDYNSAVFQGTVTDTGFVLISLK